MQHSMGHLPATKSASTKDHAGGHNHATADQEMNFRVDGMTCAGCAASVRNAIESLPGVTSASVSVTEARAHVVGSQLDSQRIVEAVQAGGYDAEPIVELPAPAELLSEIEVRQAKHEREWGRRALIGLSIWVPLESLHWIGKAAGWHPHSPTHAPGIWWMDWVMLIGATVVLIAAGGGFYRSAWSAAMRRATNMDTLIALGATTAYVYSLAVFLMILFGREVEQPLYFAEAAALLGIISLGHYMEARATARAGSAVRELLQLQPDEAEIVDAPGKETSTATGRTIPSADVKPGDCMLVRPGARVPVDGVVVEGESEIDESVVTGESMPVRKAIGDGVVAGSVNTVGRLVIRATVDGRHTTVARIADMVQKAQTSRAGIQRQADFIASIFVPAVLVIAVATVVGWMIAGNIETGVISAVTVLIISCPCALGLATPMAVMVGAGAASKAGILVKSAMAFEVAGKATCVVFDKTGTLTAGRPVVTKIERRGETTFSENEILRLAAAVEAPSEHPIARAIGNAARERGITVPAVQDFRATPGQGVRGVVENHEIVVSRDVHATAQIEVDGKVIGAITVSDQVRADSKAAIDQLHAMGLRVVLLSGDRKEVAEAIGTSLGLKREYIIAEATPESKVEFVTNLSGRTRREDAAARLNNAVIMVGDGINDAAALAAADLGIALAGGTNIAMESADVVIPGDRVAAVPQTIQIARQTLRTIRQNLFFAFFYNGVAIPLAAFGLLGASGPLIAAAAMGLSDVTVIGNAIRLKWRLSR